MPPLRCFRGLIAFVEPGFFLVPVFFVSLLRLSG